MTSINYGVGCDFMYQVVDLYTGRILGYWVLGAVNTAGLLGVLALSRVVLDKSYRDKI